MERPIMTLPSFAFTWKSVQAEAVLKSARQEMTVTETTILLNILLPPFSGEFALIKGERAVNQQIHHAL